ncbi:ribonuclease HII [Candidatus Pacearchaeota archaeon]|nr:ribonuclease HII [Candidatus Pacearchaeota archaeon]
MGKLILGIDDAGRGPVIGPMLLAGCLVRESVERELKSLGVKDSKQLTQKRREFLEKVIKEKAESFEVVILYPEEIDAKNAEGTKLNELEALAAAKIINTLNTGKEKIKVILDCPSVSINNWREFLRLQIENLSNLEIVCEHKADRNHASVSAASILAKSQREREMARLKKIYGEEIGSGYCSDPQTKKFLEKNIKNHNSKGIFRKTWSTWKKANSNSEQKKLF